MDQGLLGKISGKVDETASTSKLEPNKGSAGRTDAPPASSDETVNLTSSAKLLEKLDKTLESLPVVNQERVSEIKAAIANGDYEIDSDAIADAMVRLDRSFGE